MVEIRSRVCKILRSVYFIFNYEDNITEKNEKIIEK